MSPARARKLTRWGHRAPRRHAHVRKGTRARGAESESSKGGGGSNGWSSCSSSNIRTESGTQLPPTAFRPLAHHLRLPARAPPQHRPFFVEDSYHALARSHLHSSVREVDYELLCFARFIGLHRFCTERGIDELTFLDADVIVFDREFLAKVRIPANHSLRASTEKRVRTAWDPLSLFPGPISKETASSE